MSDTLSAWAIWAVVWGGTVFLWMWNREVRAHKRILENHHKAIMRNYEYLDKIDELELEVASLTETLDGSIAWRGRKREMTWTKTPPTEPGWYWIRGVDSRLINEGLSSLAPPQKGHHDVCERINQRDIDHKEFLHYAVCYRFDDVIWAGPIPLPEEPK